MKVAVIGASGRTGHLLVEELLRRGHQVTALARDPAKLGDLAGRVTVVTGDSRKDLGPLVTGTDAVLSALGPTRKEPTLHQDSAAVLIAAMHEHGVGRFIGISGAGIDVPGDQKSTRDVIISALIRRLGGKVVADKPAEYRAWAASDLDWTLVRPPRLKDGSPTGRVEHDAHRSVHATSIRRADLAGFLADTLEQRLYPQLAPFVGEGR